MKPKSSKARLHKLRKSKIREDAKEQGYYDGRFSTRAIPDKKKKQNKEAARKFRQKGEEGEGGENASGC
jgi:hypothetical protein